MPDTLIPTIERDQERYLKAVDYIKTAGFTSRIQIIEADALLLENELISDDPYDALFIDAAKGQYKRFFENILLSFHPEGLFIAITCSCMVWFCGKIKNYQDENARWFEI